MARNIQKNKDSQVNEKKKLKNWLFLKACEIPQLLMTSLTNFSKEKKIANNIINKKKTGKKKKKDRRA